MPLLRVHKLPDQIAAEELAGGTAVVIDVLRATTTIVYALAAGARAVVPCLSIDDARAAAARLPRGQAALAGERGGLPIAGFDLGNSPAEFTFGSVGGKTVVLTTTNGTRALLHSRAAQRILIGSFANLSALCAALAESARVELICAGTDGHETEEDLLLAGAIGDQLAADGTWMLGDVASRARSGWQVVVGDATGDDRASRIVAAMRVARGGRNLVKIGMAQDIESAAQVDRFTIVPGFDAESGEVRQGR